MPTKVFYRCTSGRSYLCSHLPVRIYVRIRETVQLERLPNPPLLCGGVHGLRRVFPAWEDLDAVVVFRLGKRRERFLRVPPPPEKAHGNGTNKTGLEIFRPKDAGVLQPSKLVGFAVVKQENGGIYDNPTMTFVVQRRGEHVSQLQSVPVAGSGKGKMST